MHIRDQGLSHCFSLCSHCLQSNLEQPQFIFASVFPDLSLFSWPPKGSWSSKARIRREKTPGLSSHRRGRVVLILRKQRDVSASLVAVIADSSLKTSKC